MTETVSATKSTIIPAVRYRDAAAAIDWLCHVFGMERHAVYPGPDNTIGHAELKLGGGMIMLGSQKDDEYGKRFRSPMESGYESQGTYLVVSDVDLVYTRARAAGGTIVRELHDTSYGGREFSVRDPEGHTWSVGTYDPWGAQAS